MSLMRLGEHLTLVQVDKRVSREYREHCTVWDGCQKCQIGKWTSPKVHFRGEMPCDALVIGEAPGREEQRRGFPFLGPSGATFESWCTWAGQKWIVHCKKAFPKLGVTNTCACRPCDAQEGSNRPPTELEQSNCEPRFRQILDMAHSKAIICLGAVARDFWLSRSYAEVRLLPTLFLPHPSPLRVGGPESVLSRQARADLLSFLELCFSKSK